MGHVALQSFDQCRTHPSMPRACCARGACDPRQSLSHTFISIRPLSRATRARDMPASTARSRILPARNLPASSTIHHSSAAHLPHSAVQPQSHHGRVMNLFCSPPSCGSGCRRTQTFLEVKHLLGTAIARTACRLFGRRLRLLSKSLADESLGTRDD